MIFILINLMEIEVVMASIIVLNCTQSCELLKALTVTTALVVIAIMLVIVIVR